MVISASWISRSGEEDGTLNMRGVSMVLALAGFLKRQCLLISVLIYLAHLPVAIGYSYWSKDIVFVISDGYFEGMQAWLSAYHGSSQSSLFDIYMFTFFLKVFRSPCATLGIDFRCDMDCT